ncbi:HEAT repeat domain-containing protein [Streptomyces sp. NBC_00234]|uniref:HEAT repeat domain-containing protein n=1 Tax=Streptomyces sp. NBC_00234 TaxID=2903638 RepID=UPI002E281120|nr:HEAT repeat domain-containing protein [Streptomyces sp. NBC_00234]
MTTPADEQLHQAIRQADVGWLARHLDPRTCPTAVLGRVVRHRDRRVRYLGLTMLAERVAPDRCTRGADLAQLATLLPDPGPGRGAAESPEEWLVLAELHERLGPHLRGRRRPEWRAAALPARVRIAWLRAELLNGPAVIRDEIPGEPLYQAVREADVAHAHRPADLVAELVGSGDSVLQAESLRLARQGLYAGLLAPAQVRAHLTRLLDADSAAVVTAALAALTEPWAATEPLPAVRLAAFLTTGRETTSPEVAAAALDAAAHHGHASVLRQVTEDPEHPPGLRRRGMELLGGLAERGDIDDLTAIAAEDPLLLGGPVTACLRGLHRRGHFPGVRHVRALVGLALADHSIPAHAFATVLFTCREELFRELVDAPADDPGWPRRLALLVALAGQGTGELPIGAALTRVLPSAPEPGPFLDAIRALRHTDAEEAVLALLPVVPGAALDTLEAIGGQRTVAALAEGLGLTTAAGAIAPPFRSVRNRALELLWHLNADPRRRRDILGRLDPAEVPARIAADLGGPDEQELALLGSRPDPDDPVVALCGLAARGSAGALPAVADLLLRVVGGLAASWEALADDPPTDDGRAVGEPSVPQEIVDAVHALGGRLRARQRIRPVCLLGTADAREAGHALVASLALDLLERPGLSAGEQAILLKLLLQAPSAHTRPRVHRFLRHRDRHVRKQVIALLARDAEGHDAQALSATLIALTRAQDVQTVRQALLALGHARARWACLPIAACLDHPTMNVRKTAASALARAGAPAAVPKLLSVLGRHDNPGLRASLVEALRAVLGGAFAATVLAAAEGADDERTRALLLEALDGMLSARSVLALDEQESPAVPALLTLLAAGRVTLGSGTAGDLAEAMAGHGVTAPTAPGPGPRESPDADVSSLLAGEWSDPVALRLAVRPVPPSPGRMRDLRPTLAQWLRLAVATPDAAGRHRVLRFALRLCPAPWADAELTAFARSARLLTDELGRTAGDGRDTGGLSYGHQLLGVLVAVAPRLPAATRPALADAVRAQPPALAGSTATLTLLRGCGAVLLRGDLDHALAAARLGADPWRAETAVLREAFTVGPPEAVERGAGTGTPVHERSLSDAAAWRTALDTALRTRQTLEEFRRRDSGSTPDSRVRLSALVDVFPGADAGVRAALLDWMTDLQPLDVPPWTMAETASARSEDPRSVRYDDLDQPRSTALRARLLTMLEADAPDRRNAAARELLTWPEPEASLAVLRAFLRGRVTVRVDEAMARTLTALGDTELRSEGIVRERVVHVALRLGSWPLVPLIPLLLEWWEHGPAALRADAGRALRNAPADVLAQSLDGHLADGAWGYLDLLSGPALLRTSALTRVCRRLRTEGRDDLADGLRLVDGPLRGEDAAREDIAAPRTPLDRHRDGLAGTGSRPTREDLLELARTGDPARVRRALTRLAEEHSGPAPDHDPALRELIEDLLTHPRPGVRLHAHRTSRRMLERHTHLHHTAILLDDPQPDILRLAIRTLTHAGWEPAVPALTVLLDHPRPVVRRAAAEGLRRMGAAAVPALRHAAGRARPDKRDLYLDALADIRSTEDG